jgi:hypothetical protein
MLITITLCQIRLPRSVLVGVFGQMVDVVHFLWKRIDAYSNECGHDEEDVNFEPH